MQETALNLIPIAQELPDENIGDVPSALLAELERVKLKLKPGSRIALAVGSRGIADIQSVVATLVGAVRQRGGEPFIVPAMGSHGGATADGQTEVLAGYGIDEASVGAPVRSSMETVELPRGDAPCRVFMDRQAFESDGVIAVNRVKSHTDFHGPHESGIVKMLVIGLGNQDQALEVHKSGVKGLRDFVPAVAREVLATGKVLLGVGLIENAHHHLAEIRAVTPPEFHSADHELLERSRSIEPRLPTPDIDVLVVDQIGKDLSGTGLDTNVIGRMSIAGEADPDSPRVRAIVACGLTEGSHGNAIGVGLADVITREFYESIDIDATAQNAMTSTFFARGKIPLVAPTPADAYAWALRSCWTTPADSLRVVRIRDTLSLEELLVSTTVWEDIRNNPAITRTGSETRVFDDDGRLAPVWSTG